MQHSTKIITIMLLIGAAGLAAQEHTYILSSDGYFLELAYNETTHMMYLENNVTLPAGKTYHYLAYQNVGGYPHIIITANDSTNGYIYDYVKQSGSWSLDNTITISGATGITHAVRDSTGYYYYTIETGASTPGTGAYNAYTRVIKTLTGATISSWDVHTATLTSGSAGGSSVTSTGQLFMGADAGGQYLVIMPIQYNTAGTSVTDYYAYIVKLYPQNSSTETLNTVYVNYAGTFYYFKSWHYNERGEYAYYTSTGTRKLSDLENNTITINAVNLPAAPVNLDNTEYDYLYNDTQVRGIRYYTGAGTYESEYNDTNLVDIVPETSYVTGTSTETETASVTINAWEGTSSCGPLAPLDGVTCTLSTQTCTTANGSITTATTSTQLKPLAAVFTQETQDADSDWDYDIYFENNENTDLWVKYWQGKDDTGNNIAVAYLFMKAPTHVSDINITEWLYNYVYYYYNGYPNLFGADDYNDGNWNEMILIGYNSTAYNQITFSKLPGQNITMTAEIVNATSVNIDMTKYSWAGGQAPWDTPDYFIEYNDTRPLITIDAHDWIRVFMLVQHGGIQYKHQFNVKLYEGRLVYSYQKIENASSCQTTVNTGTQTLYCIAPTGYVFDETMTPILSKDVTITHDEQQIDVLLQKIKQVNLLVNVYSSTIPDGIPGAKCTLPELDRAAYANEEGYCVFENVPVNWNGTLVIDAGVQGYAQRSMLVSLGDYYNTQRLYDTKACTLENPINYTIRANLDLMAGVKLHIHTKARVGEDTVSVTNVKITYLENNSIKTVTDDTGTGVLELPYANAWTFNFYRADMGINYTTIIYQSDIAFSRTGEGSVTVYLPYEQLPTSLTQVKEELSKKFEAGDAWGILATLLSNMFFWGIAVMAVLAFAGLYVTKSLDGGVVGALAGLGLGLTFGLLPLAIVIVMGILFAGAWAMLTGKLSLGGV